MNWRASSACCAARSRVAIGSSAPAPRIHRGRGLRSGCRGESPAPTRRMAPPRSPSQRQRLPLHVSNVRAPAPDPGPALGLTAPAGTSAGAHPRDPRSMEPRRGPVSEWSAPRVRCCRRPPDRCEERSCPDSARPGAWPAPVDDGHQLARKGGIDLPERLGRFLQDLVQGRATESPSNAFRPPSSSYRTTPTEKMSERWSARSPRTCSGAM